MSQMKFPIAEKTNEFNSIKIGNKFDAIIDLLTSVSIYAGLLFRPQTT